MVLAWALSLISTFTSTLSFKFVLKLGRETLHPVLVKMTSFSDISCVLFYFYQWNNRFRRYLSITFGPKLSLSVWLIIINKYRKSFRFSANVLLQVWFLQKKIMWWYYSILGTKNLLWEWKKEIFNNKINQITIFSIFSYSWISKR